MRRPIGLTLEFNKKLSINTPMSLQIGKILSQLIENRRLTLKEISEATGVPASTLGEWKTNRSPRNPEQVREVARFFEVSMHYLLFGEEDQDSSLQKILKDDVFQGTYEIILRKVKIK